MKVKEIEIEKEKRTFKEPWRQNEMEKIGAMERERETEGD